MKTLVYHNGGLGDFIAIIPFLKNLRKEDANNISILGKPFYAQLAKAAGLIDEIHDANSINYTHLFSDYPDFRTFDFLGSFNRFFIFSDMASPLVTNIRRFGNSQLFLQTPFPAENIHIINYHLSLINSNFTDADISFPEFVIPQNHLAIIDDYFSDNQKKIAINPGSGSRIKNWAFDNYTNLSIYLKNLGYKIFWICGPAEIDFKFAENDNILKDINILSLTAFLKRCDVYIGNDSGVTHLAAASGCKTIALFGASNPDIWRPVGKQVRLVYKKQKCSPCHLAPFRKQNCNRECMNSITLNDVLNVLNNFD